MFSLEPKREVANRCYMRALHKHILWVTHKQILWVTHKTDPLGNTQTNPLGNTQTDPLGSTQTDPLGNTQAIFASQGLRFGSPFSPPLADLVHILRIHALIFHWLRLPVHVVINLIWKHLRLTK
jgi:hypothetical protein